MIDRAIIAMFPFAHLDGAFDTVWTSLRNRVEWLPETLEKSGVPSLSWLDPSLALGMTCGWPLVSNLRDQVRCIGSFHYTVDGAEEFRYRSTVVTSSAVLQPTPNTRAVINDPLSLSGHISLLRYMGVKTWPGELITSGGHRSSLEIIGRGEADIASIDAVSLAHLLEADPAVMNNVNIVGAGPLVPTLPLICSAAASDSQVAELRQGIAATVADPANSEAMATLRISGFTPLDLSDYDRHLL